MRFQAARPWFEGFPIVKKFFGICLVLLAFCGVARGQGMTQPEGVRALINGVGALSAAAVLTAVRTAETGSFTLAGRAIPFTLASAGIFAALQWGFDQAKIAAGSPLDVWNNYTGSGCNAAPFESPTYGASTKVSCIASEQGALYGDCPVGMSCFAWVNNYAWGTCATANRQTFVIVQSGDVNAIYAAYVAACQRAGTPRPPLSDWIAGTYTPLAGQTAVAHPDAAVQLRGLLQDKIVSDNPQSSNDAGSLGISIYPSVPDIEWHIGVPSCAGGSIWDNAVRSCVNLTCEAGQLINLATNSCGVPPVCAAGSRRVGSSWACTPNPTCPAGSSFDTSTNQCRPDEAPCVGGNVRDPITRQCRPPDGCPTGQIRSAGGVCEAVQCPTGQILDPVTNLCSDGKPTVLPPTPFDQLLAKIGAAITRIVALGANKIPFGLASYFPSFSAGSGCDETDIVIPMSTLGSATIPICSNAGVVFWRNYIRPALLGVFTVLGALWIVKTGLQS